MKDDNVCPFLGVTVNYPTIYVLFLHSPKGTLRRVLHAKETKLDLAFRLSFVMDLSNGLNYIHSSALGKHGALNYDSCVVDDRWVVKITLYGLYSFFDAKRKQTIFNKYKKDKAQGETPPSDDLQDVE